MQAIGQPVYVVRGCRRVTELAGVHQFVDSAYGASRPAADRKRVIETEETDLTRATPSAIVERYPVDELADAE